LIISFVEPEAGFIENKKKYLSNSAWYFMVGIGYAVQVEGTSGTLAPEP
jgi:hypothetical protein